MPVYWVTGNSHIGKTTFMKLMEKEKNNKCLFIGEELRKKYGDDYFIKQENSVTPKSTEEEVRDTVKSFLQVFHCIDSVENIFIDGFPRSEDQLKEVVRLSSMYSSYKRHEILVLLGERKLPDGNKSEDLVNKRRKDEYHLFDRLVNKFVQFMSPDVLTNLDCMMNIGMKVCFIKKDLKTCDWANKIADCVEISLKTNLDYIFKRHLELDELYTSRYGIDARSVFKEINLLDNISVKSSAFIEAMINRMKEEIDELYKEIHVKFWDKNKIDVRKIKVELVDVLHFWFTLASCFMVNSNELGSVYLGKREVNIHRTKVGKKKGDDCHVGIPKK